MHRSLEDGGLVTGKDDKGAARSTQRRYHVQRHGRNPGTVNSIVKAMAKNKLG